MTYDLIRWAVGIVLFFLLIVVLSLITKKKGKSVLISAYTSVILVAVSLVFPIENAFYSFKSVEDIFNYRCHESLLTYAECDEGVVCIAQKDELNSVYYSFNKDARGYKLPNNIERVMKTIKGNSFRSSDKGVFFFESFNNQTVIITQVLNSAYDGNEFVDCSNGYYKFTVVNGVIDYSLLTCNGERVRLI